ncbi:SsgA family sporulation/cell division regulator [Actinopolymorpha sp. B9G3]|uniref:SsgA family sporulation/cell division regulator n=1 Tax=Actinopolymorpha sp. B9G3 TaxID=3158970 RepID=UPI0032D95AD7
MGTHPHLPPPTRHRHGVARWVVSRDLLWEGLRWSCGEGDVRIEPAAPMVAITLRPPGEAATVHMAARQLAGFLDRTNALVPPGTEASYVDLDRFLESLL